MVMKSDPQIGVSVDTGDRLVGAGCKDADGKYDIPLVDNDGHLQVDILSGAGAGTQYADGDARGTATGTLAMIDDGTNIQSMAGSTGGQPYIQIRDGQGNARSAYVNGSNQLNITGPVTQSGTWNVGTVTTVTTVAAVTAITNALPAGTNNIGDVDIVSGTITTLSTLTGSGVAHDASDSGNPHKIGFKAYSPDGTTPGTAVAELDRSDAKGDLDGRLFVNPVHPRDFSYHDDDVAAVTTDGTVAADPGDGFAVFITDVIFSIGAATASSIFLEEGSTKILGPYYLEAVAGRGVVIHFATPKRCTASTAILVTNTGSITFSIDILGFVAAV